MPRTKRTGDSKRRVEQFKIKNRRMSNQNKQAVNATANQQPQMPQVIEIPYWNATDDISLTGKEFEMAYNSIHQLQQLSQGLFGVANSIMQRNIFDGTIKVKFQKLTEVDGQPEYVDMTDEEQAPHQEEFANLVASLKANKETAKQLVDQQGPLLDAIVDANGNVPGTPVQLVDQDGDVIKSSDKISETVNITPSEQSNN